jgi:hypothetical protein
MAVADAPQLRSKVAGEVKSTRNALRRLLPALNELLRVETVDRFGKFVIEPDEELDQTLEQDLVSMLRMARKDHPGQEIEVVVIARQGRDKGEGT